MNNALSISLQNTTYKFLILRPAGNDTALVLSFVEDEQLRQQINNQILKKYPNVEQVGFVDLSSNSPKLIMAGGEFQGFTKTSGLGQRHSNSLLRNRLWE